MELLIPLGLAAVFVFFVWRGIFKREDARRGPDGHMPASSAELRMWEKHYGLQAQRGLTPDQRKAEIAQLRARDGI